MNSAFDKNVKISQLSRLELEEMLNPLSYLNWNMVNLQNLIQITNSNPRKVEFLKIRLKLEGLEVLEKLSTNIYNPTDPWRFWSAFFDTDEALISSYARLGQLFAPSFTSRLLSIVWRDYVNNFDELQTNLNQFTQNSLLRYVYPRKHIDGFYEVPRDVFAYLTLLNQNATKLAVFYAIKSMIVPASISEENLAELIPNIHNIISALYWGKRNGKIGEVTDIYQSLWHKYRLTSYYHLFSLSTEILMTMLT